MTKAELIEAVTNKANGTLTKKAAGEMVDNMFDILAKTIKKEGRFSFPGFGTWTVRKRNARKGRNPQTGAQITIKASKTVGFRPGTDLKGSV